MPYCAITADVRGSREVEDRAGLQKQILAAIAAVNTEFEQELLVPFAISVGDEWQGLLKSIAPAWRIVLAFQDTLHEYDLAFGIGEGEIATPIAERSAEMDGEAFHRSREALESAKESEKPAEFRTTTPNIDLLLNALVSAMNIISSGWTDRQRETVRLYRRMKSVSKVAEAQGVTRMSASKTLLSLNAQQFRECERRIDEYLRARVGKNQ